MRRLIPIALAALFLQGCGTFMDPTEWFSSSEVVEPSPLVELEDPIQPQVLWTRQVGVGTDGQRLGLSPYLADGVLLVADARGRVEALGAEDGRPRWSVDLDMPLSGGPGAGEGLVLLGGGEADVVALSADNGSLRWTAEVSSEVLSVPAVTAGAVIVQTIDGKVIGLEVTNGNQRWRYEREVPALTLRGTGSPVVSGGAVYVGMSGGRLVALRADSGGVLWDATVTAPSGRSELQRLADIDGDPIVLGGGVFAATYQGEVAALEQSSGRAAWRQALSVHSSLGADRLGIYASDSDGVVWGLDIRTGSVRWRQEALKHRRLSDVAVIDGLVVVGDFEGYLHWLDREDGGLVARTRVGSAPITGGLLAADGVLFVQGDGDDVAAIRPPAL
jgi:outer membrane protein assembly factor BamB